MSEVSNQKLVAAVQSLSRVRAAESEPDDRGGKTVWHQGAKGGDLLTHVDSKGRVSRWELTLLDEHFLWTSERGLRTGKVNEARGAGMTVASTSVNLDPGIDPERLKRAAAGLTTYSGEDKYLLNVKRIITLAASGLESSGEVTVTTMRVLKEPEPESAFAGKRLYLLAGGILLVGAIGVAVLYLR